MFLRHKRQEKNIVILKPVYDSSQNKEIFVLKGEFLPKTE